MNNRLNNPFQELADARYVSDLRRVKNPEQDVCDAIDQLVNDQLEIGPVDDYNADRYDKCEHCLHDWHGLQCEHCLCDGTAESVRRSVAARVREPRRDINFHVDIGDDPGEGYTIPDIQLLRSPRVRFWAQPLDGDHPQYLEGQLVSQELELCENALSVVAEIRDLYPAEPNAEPVQEIPTGQVALERADENGYTHVGFIDEDDITFDHRVDYQVMTFGGDVIRSQERYEVRMRFQRQIEVLNTLLEALTGLGL